MALAYKEEYVLGIQLEDAIKKGYYGMYVNAYCEQLVYGGPEEGGWWFTFGEPLESIRFWNEGQARTCFHTLEDIYKPQFEDEPGKSSVISEGDLRIVIEDHPAKSYPNHRPHYE